MCSTPQGKKTLSDVLTLCYAAVTYHELFKLAAQDALDVLQREQWRALYDELDADGDGGLAREEVAAKLAELGATRDAAEDVLASLFRGASRVDVDAFTQRAMRLRSPLKLGFLA